MTGQALSTGHVIWAPVSVCVSQEWVGVAATSVKPTTTASLTKGAKVRHDFLEIYFKKKSCQSDGVAAFKFCRSCHLFANLAT